MIEIIHYLDILGLVFSCVVLFTISASIFFLNRKSIINQTFSAMAFALFVWAVGALLRHTVNTYEFTILSQRITHGFAAIGILFILYFNLVYPKGKDLPLWVKILILLPAVFISFASIFTGLVVAGFSASDPEYVYIGSILYGPLIGFYVIYSGIYTFGAILVIFYKIFRAQLRERIQLVYVAIAFLYGTITVQIFALWLPTIGLSHFESFGRLTLIPTMSIIAFAILRYRLFVVTPQVAAQEIVDALSRSLLVCNINGNILYQSEIKIGISEIEKRKIIAKALERGEIIEHKTVIDGDSYNMSASLFRVGEGIVMIFDDLTEIEKEEYQEKVLNEKLSGKYKNDKMIRQLLQNLVTSSRIGESFVSAVEILGQEPEAMNALKKMVELVQGRRQLLEGIETEKTKLETKLKEIEKINKKLVDRELKMVEIKQFIKELKGKEDFK